MKGLSTQFPSVRSASSNILVTFFINIHSTVSRDTRNWRATPVPVSYFKLHGSVSCGPRNRCTTPRELLTGRTII